MKTLGIMAILFATVAAPAIAERDRDARRGLRRMLLFLLGFDALYAAYLTLVHARLFFPTRW